MRSLEETFQNYRSGIESEKREYLNSNRYGHTSATNKKTMEDTIYLRIGNN